MPKTVQSNQSTIEKIEIYNKIKEKNTIIASDLYIGLEKVRLSSQLNFT